MQVALFWMSVVNKWLLHSWIGVLIGVGNRTFIKQSDTPAEVQQPSLSTSELVDYCAHSVSAWKSFKTIEDEGQFRTGHKNTTQWLTSMKVTGNWHLTQICFVFFEISVTLQRNYIGHRLLLLPHRFDKIPGIGRGGGRVWGDGQHDNLRDDVVWIRL